MITVKDWIAFLPEEDKHIAYVGEHESVTRQFLLTGTDWQDYVDWGFHLDMAFDLSSVTSRQQHKMEKTQVSNTENITETQIKNTGTTTKESYTVEEVDVDCAAETDIALLTKTQREDGLCLTWRVLRQHTQLPGSLQATIRALGPDGQIKKSSLMVFEVDAAVVAESAAEIPESEFEEAERYVDAVLSSVTKSAQAVESVANRVEAIRDEVIDSATDVRYWGEQARSWGIHTNTAAESVTTEVRQNRSVVERMFDCQESTNLLDMNAVTIGKGMDKSGSIGSTTEYDLSLTGFIPVKAGDRISYQRTNKETGKREFWYLYLVCLFDEYKQVTKIDHSFTPEADGSLRCITIPEGVSYVRLTLHDLPVSLEPALVRGNALVPYEPYDPRYWIKKETLRLGDLLDMIQPVQTVAQTLSDDQKQQVRTNIGALAEDFTVTADEKLDGSSRNPISNMAIATVLNQRVFGHLLPSVNMEDTYKILRVCMNGKGYEFVPIQEDLYMQNWVLPYLLPRVTEADNGKTIQVVNGTWQLV